ncbi:hypothetical protein [Moorena sp. SIO4G3]|nr:hypothetical protein [Moorena sp. SIO4G3]NEO79622.1 hypothetical protein [Moorena sp. SIO4G3]
MRYTDFLPCSLFFLPYSLFPIPCSLFFLPYSLLYLTEFKPSIIFILS